MNFLFFIFSCSGMFRNVPECSSLRTADVFPVVASLPPKIASAIYTAPEMISTPKWSPNWPRNDPDPKMIPIFLLVDPEMIPKELWNCDETWDCGLLFCSFSKCCNPVISFYSCQVSNKRKLVVGSLSRSSRPLTHLVWCNVSNRVVFSSSSVLCFTKPYFRERW